MNMMPIATAELIRELDRRTIEEIGIPGVVLMENAGRGAVKILRERFDALESAPVAVVCGGGNNGGDGFVMARTLVQGGIEAKVYLLSSADRVRGDARVYLDVLTRLEIPVVDLGAEGEIPGRVVEEWKGASCIVDAIFGTGLSRPVEGRYRRAIEAIEASGRPVLAVDLPSGICSDTGRVLGAAVHARCTATFGLPKMGLLIHPGAAHAGIVECVDIGIPRRLVDALRGGDEILEPAPLLGIFQREPDTHKGRCGHLLVVAGSRGKTGAAALCCEAALRCGAGLVTLAIPASLNGVMEEKLTEAMTLPMPETDAGTFSEAALEEILEFASSVQGMVVGPGLGLNEETERLVRVLRLHARVPVVWDADALTLLAGKEEAGGGARGEVFTPHPGEMGRLLERTSAWVQENRLAAVRELASRWGAVAILKGARTLVAAPDGRLRVNLTGNPGMATGGMGDVLCGMVGGLLVQGMEAYEAASLAVWLHGAAGDRLAGRVGPLGYLASELMREIPTLIGGRKAECPPVG